MELAIWVTVNTLSGLGKLEINNGLTNIDVINNKDPALNHAFLFRFEGLF